jgi:hypothetical protein
LLAILPVLMALLFLCALMLPEPQALRHAAAVMAVVLAGLSLWVFRETAFIGSLGLIYSGLWGLWYWQAVWQAGTGQVP